MKHNDVAYHDSCFGCHRCGQQLTTCITVALKPVGGWRYSRAKLICLFGCVQFCAPCAKVALVALKQKAIAKRARTATLSTDESAPVRAAPSRAATAAFSSVAAEQHGAGPVKSAPSRRTKPYACGVLRVPIAECRSGAQVDDGRGVVATKASAAPAGVARRAIGRRAGQTGTAATAITRCANGRRASQTSAATTAVARREQRCGRAAQSGAAPPQFGASDDNGDDDRWQQAAAHAVWATHGRTAHKATRQRRRRC